MKKILITGGAGYIGSHTIIEILEKHQGEVLSADNYSNSSAETFKRIKDITGKEVMNHVVDLCNAEATRNIFEQHKDIEGIIHFAAYKSVPESVENPLLYYHNNIESLVNVLACARAFKVPYFIFSSSCAVYGNIAQLPVDENTITPKANSPYGYTKQVGEELLKDFSKANPQIKTVALRYFNPVGAHPSGTIGEVPVQRPNNLVPMITQTAVGKHKEMMVYGDDYDTRDGTCVRDYIHVCDIARAHINALTYLKENKSAPGFSLFNLGSGKGVSVMEMIKTFEKVSEQKLNYVIAKRRPGDVAAIYSNSSLAKNVLDWEPQYSLTDMMSSAWKWELHQKNN
jgi:UDP-glucose 4-epimerase